MTDTRRRLVELIKATALLSGLRMISCKGIALSNRSDAAITNDSIQTDQCAAVSYRLMRAGSGTLVLQDAAIFRRLVELNANYRELRAGL